VPGFPRIRAVRGVFLRPAKGSAYGNAHRVLVRFSWFTRQGAAGWRNAAIHVVEEDQTMKTIAIAGLLAFALSAVSCGTVTGAAVGAGAGAAIGAGTGYGAKEGALIGTGVGAAAGAIYDITK
jgi:hypothetical protein